MITHASFFSGIGGFDLAAEWLGWETVLHCEINPFGKKVLNYYWPNAKQYDDIKKSDFTIWRGRVDVLSGGFPCQPYSVAGKRLGKEDERHLWPELFRAIREIKPTWVLGENVRGLVNWNRGMVFEEVQADLESEGYEVLPFMVPACAVNAPHRRDRIWFVAYNTDARNESMRPERQDSIYGFEFTTNPDSNERCERRMYQDRPGQTERLISECNTWPDWRAWQNFPTQPPVCYGNDGIPSRLDSITFPKWRNESIKAAGNAVVPQVVYQFYKVIDTMIRKNNFKNNFAN